VIAYRHPRAVKTGQYALLVVYIVFLAFPLLWLLSVSFKGPRELVELHPSFWPSHPTLGNYHVALHENDLVHAGLNSLQVAVATAFLPRWSACRPPTSSRGAGAGSSARASPGSCSARCSR